MLIANLDDAFACIQRENLLRQGVWIMLAVISQIHMLRQHSARQHSAHAFSPALAAWYGNRCLDSPFTISSAKTSSVTRIRLNTRQMQI